MPNFREAYEAIRYTVEQALGLEPAPSLDELQTASGRADGAFAIELAWLPHGEAPGRWALDHPGRTEGTLGVSWQRRVVTDAPLDTEAQIVTDGDRVMTALMFGETVALAEITIRFLGFRPVAASTREWRRGRCDFSFDHYYDAEAA